jgi:hypothetical protein
MAPSFPFGSDDHALVSLLLPWYSAPVPLVVTCVQCRQEILEADRSGEEEECLLRDHLLAVHPRTVQPMTRSGLLRLFFVSERPPLAA